MHFGFRFFAQAVAPKPPAVPAASTPQARTMRPSPPSDLRRLLPASRCAPLKAARIMHGHGRHGAPTCSSSVLREASRQPIAAPCAALVRRCATREFPVAIAGEFGHIGAACGVRRASGCSSGVEHNLAKVGVEGSNPFARSSFPTSPKPRNSAAFVVSGRLKSQGAEAAEMVSVTRGLPVCGFDRA